MISEGQIILFKFSQTDQTERKLRPALVLRKLPGKLDDWLICMISSQLHQKLPDLDEMITPDDSDFLESGLKVSSVIRTSRLAVVNSEILLADRSTNCRKNLWVFGCFYDNCLGNETVGKRGCISEVKDQR